VGNIVRSVAVCGSASGSVLPIAHSSVRQCAAVRQYSAVQEQCAAVSVWQCAAVCGSARGSLYVAVHVAV
jgi:hypothetical protein